MYRVLFTIRDNNVLVTVWCRKRSNAMGCQNHTNVPCVHPATVNGARYFLEHYIVREYNILNTLELNTCYSDNVPCCPLTVWLKHPRNGVWGIRSSDSSDLPWTCAHLPDEAWNNPNF